MTPRSRELLDKIESRDATVAIVGLGYVGLPLARAMHDAGFRVLAYDHDAARVAQLEKGEGYLKHLGEDLVANLAASDRFSATADPKRLGEGDAILLCVPSPLGRHGEPDMSYIRNSTAMVRDTLRPGQLVVLESTTYPGTTRGECLPILEESGLKLGDDFFLAFSPEREDPGSAHDTRSIPKLVGGVDDSSGPVATALYAAAVQEVVPVDTCEIAESAKLLENIYRAVNIALVNELKPVLHSMGIDVWKVIAAAATKPFGYQPFYPGPGLGGHCIPIDPFYLTWKAKEFGHHTRFIELAGQINSSMPGYVLERLVEGLNQHGKAIRGAKVLVLGIAYKKNVDDIRETPAAEIIKQLQDRGAQVTYHDPHVAAWHRMRRYHHTLRSVDLDAERIAGADCCLVLTDHDAIDWQLVADHATLVVDTRNVMAAHAPIRGLLVQA